MRYSKLIILAFSLCFSFNSHSQQIISLGAWPNNPNFAVKYYNNRCITNTGSPIKILDFTIPSSPSVTATLPTSGPFANAVEASVNNAYLVGGMVRYVMIADITNINAPIQTGSLNNISGTGRRIAINGNYAFVPTYSDTLYAIDITNKNAPSVVKRLYLNGSARGIFIKGNYAYVATSNGIKVVNILNPPTMTISASFAGSYSDMVGDLATNRLFASNSTMGFDVIDITNPVNPVFLFQGSGGNTDDEIEFKNGYVFQANDAFGTISAFKINASSANFLCSYTTSNQINAISAKDSVFFVADNFNVHCLKLSLSAVATNIQKSTSDKGINIYPNPIKGSFNIDAGSEIKNGEIILFNLNGQEVEKIEINSGSNTINEHELAKGVYNYKLFSDREQISSGKIIFE